ncbi:RidA family protein [Paenibacillus sp. GCM10027626]|uniref:RidA family protein n=1 Tax=Paenibacillus sp. GCM10027626 TaxID=3273411 RepID=UPI003640A19E
MAEKKEIKTSSALHSGANYSQAILAGDSVYVAGQVPIDPYTKQVTGETVAEQTRSVLTYIKAILAEAGCTMDDIVKINCYLTDISKFQEMNEVFAEFFSRPYPARVTVGVQLIGFQVEMDCTARLPAWRKQNEL